MHALPKFLLVGSLIGGLVGCSSSGSGAQKNPDSSKATTTTVAGKTGGDKAAAPLKTGQIDRDGASLKAGKGISKTTHMTHCDTQPGPVKASGTVQLPKGMDPSKVLISVAWVNAANANAIGIRKITVDNVTADAPTDWSTENVLPDNKGVTIRCSVGAVALDG